MSLFKLLQLVGATAILVYLVKWLIEMYEYHKKMSKLKLYTKGALPIIGNIKMVMNGSNKFWDIFRQISQAASEGEGYIRVRVGPRNEIYVSDPDIALSILNTCFNKHYVYKFASCWLENGIIQADSDIWKVHRKLINPTFSQHVLNGFIGVFNLQSQWLVKEFKSNVGMGPFDPRRKMSEQTLKTVCQTVLGLNTEDVIDEEYLNAVEKIFKIFAKRVTHINLHPSFIYGTTSTKTEQDKCVKVLHNMSRSMVLKRKQERENGQQNQTSSKSASRFTALLDLFLTMNEQGLVDLEQIRMELDTFIAAGHDTTNRAVLFILIYIGSFPEVQEKIYEEIQSVLGDQEYIGKDDLPKLVYTEAVIKESLRVTTVVPMVGRILDRDVKHNNIVFPKGASVVIALWGITHDKKLWGSDADEFKPERWLNPDTLPKHPNAYCPFSIGRRNCIGKNYAYMSMKMTLCYLVRNYKITADYAKLKTRFDILLRATEGYEITLEHRK